MAKTNINTITAKQSAIGLLFVGIFTFFWGYFSNKLIKGDDYYAFIILSFIIGTFFIKQALHYLRHLKLAIDDNNTISSMWFSISLAIIFSLILIIYFILNSLNKSLFFLPSAQLLLGILAFIFAYKVKRQKDYLIGSFYCFISLICFFLLRSEDRDTEMIQLVVCISSQFGAIIYGVSVLNKMKIINTGTPPPPPFVG